MNIGQLIMALLLFIVVLTGAIIFVIKRPKRLKSERFVASWKELQGYCKEKSTWPEAVIEADRLLNAALKKRKFKGKTMGERMVSAQRIFTNNDDMWFAHNLAKKIKANDAKLNEADVKTALQGFRQALRDIGALPQPGEEGTHANH